MTPQTKFPRGRDQKRVRRVLEHYEEQSDEEALVEDEAAFESTTHTVMEVPVELVPAVRELLANGGSADGEIWHCHGRSATFSPRLR